jgi:hypothetical protein
MATFLLYRTFGSRANANGRNAVIAPGASAAAALAAAQAAAPDGETKPDASWANVQLSTTENAIAAPIWISGDIVEPLQRHKSK